MAEIYNSTPFVSQNYDKSVRQVIPFYDAIQSETIDVVRTVKPEVKQWLDTGCGTGYLAETALTVFPDTTFILADPAEAMLQAAMQRLESFPDNRVKFLPPTPTDGLLIYQETLKPQVITAILCHHYYNREQRRTATSICYSLLADDGLYITVENVMSSSPQGIQFTLERWKRFQIEHGRTREKAEEHASRFNFEYFPISINDHFALLREAGFETVELFWKSYMQAGFYAVK